MVMTMYSKDISYFLTLAHYCSVTAAAQALEISQSALSVFLKNLEHSLGVSLFYRSRQGLALTAEGLEYLTYCKAVDEHHKSLQNRLNQLTNGKSSTLTIGVPSRRSPLLIPPLLKLMKHQAPQLNLSFIEATQNTLMSLLEQGKIDLCFTNYFAHHKHYRAFELGFDPLVILIPPALRKHITPRIKKGFRHPWIQLPQLREHTFILPGKHQSLRHYIDILFQELSLKPQNTCEIHNIETAITLAQEDYGIAFSLESYVKHLPLRPEPALYTSGKYQLGAHIFLSCRKQTEHTEGVKEVLFCAQQLFSKAHSSKKQND